MGVLIGAQRPPKSSTQSHLSKGTWRVSPSVLGAGAVWRLHSTERHLHTGQSAERPGMRKRPLGPRARNNTVHPLKKLQNKLPKGHTDRKTNSHQQDSLQPSQNYKASPSSPTTGKTNCEDPETVSMPGRRDAQEGHSEMWEAATRCRTVFQRIQKTRWSQGASRWRLSAETRNAPKNKTGILTCKVQYLEWKYHWVGCK